MKIKKDPRVSIAIPVAMGDYTEKGGFPIVGTIPEFFKDELPLRGREFLVGAGGGCLPLLATSMRTSVHAVALKISGSRDRN